MARNLIELPDFNIDQSKIPQIRLKSIHFEKFKAFEDFHLNFIDESNAQLVKPFVCFIGPNGCGKSTILDSIQLIFSRFDGRDKEKIKCNLGRCVRHIDGKHNGIYGEDNFLITALIQSSLGDYEIQIDKSGFIKDHPDEVKFLVYRLCYYARFDQELKIFSLERKQWPRFQELFKAITGFDTKEIDGLFDQSFDPVQSEMLNQYVLSFNVYKPDEVIQHTECSAGERKIIKTFSTLLNKDYNPQIILIDNVAMHIESGRHLNFIQSMKNCFPDAQIFATTHSYRISRNFGERNQLYDLRFIKTSDIIKNQKWRLYLADEIEDSLCKLSAMSSCQKKAGQYVIIGKELLKKILNQKILEEKMILETQKFLSDVSEIFVFDVVKYYSKSNGL